MFWKHKIELLISINLTKISCTKIKVLILKKKLKNLMK